jgi:hypothetical protein
MTIQLMPTKSNLVTFVEMFESETEKLKKAVPQVEGAFISFCGEGCFSKEEALEFIENLTDETMPESFCYAVQVEDDDCVVSIYIGRNIEGDKWQLEHHNMVPVRNYYADSIEEAYSYLKNSVTDFLNIEPYEPTQAQLDALKIVK